MGKEETRKGDKIRSFEEGRRGRDEEKGVKRETLDKEKNTVAEKELSRRFTQGRTCTNGFQRQTELITIIKKGRKKNTD